jgi:hypothetical protein
MRTVVLDVGTNADTNCDLIAAITTADAKSIRLDRLVEGDRFDDSILLLVCLGKISQSFLNSLSLPLSSLCPGGHEKVYQPRLFAPESEEESSTSERCSRRRCVGRDVFGFRLVRLILNRNANENRRIEPHNTAAMIYQQQDALQNPLDDLMWLLM